ncbi:MAG TPA: 3-hydroxyacyl-ACP dehydratase FabZ [Coxiellaceae bacterium]|nr:3-hydroxyacyl-ACP dehydratase FabZ [Coxiellaceae bacterium]
MDINEIKKYLPHRYPFLLVDRVIAFEHDKSIVAIKNVTVNEPFFNGHFPFRPVMPGVLMIEALAQASGLLTLKTLGEEFTPGNLFLFAGVDNARFKRVVEPGDQLILEVEVLKRRRDLCKFKGIARVGDELACEAEFMTIREKRS